MGKGVVPGRKLPTVSEGDAAALDPPDLDAFAVDQLFAVVRLKQQPVTGRYFQLSNLTDIEGGSVATGIEGLFGTIRETQPECPG